MGRFDTVFRYDYRGVVSVLKFIGIDNSQECDIIAKERCGFNDWEE